MIYKITTGYDTVRILENSSTELIIIFDLEPEVYPSDIAVVYKVCSECGMESFFGLDDDQVYCDEDECEGYLDGTHADLVIQGDKVLYRRPR
jgi:hypothetical protein